jgi:hypothetical protein
VAEGCSEIFCERFDPQPAASIRDRSSKTDVPIAFCFNKRIAVKNRECIIEGNLGDLLRIQTCPRLFNRWKMLHPQGEKKANLFIGWLCPSNCNRHIVLGKTA